MVPGDLVQMTEGGFPPLMARPVGQLTPSPAVLAVNLVPNEVVAGSVAVFVVPLLAAATLAEEEDRQLVYFLAVMT